MRAPVIAISVIVAAVAAAACSSSSSSSSPTTVHAVSPVRGANATGPQAQRPAGPAADVSQELTGGKGVFLGEGNPPDLAKLGFVQHEYLTEGRATAYKAVGKQGNDGRWTFAATTTAPYRTRVIVRRPADMSKFSGTVVVEWLNVSGGLDAGPDWTSLEEELVRADDAWVGVSAQLIGVEGGPVLVSAPGAEGITGKGLKKLDPARYGTLQHPGDGYSFDIYTQVARALRAGAAPLDGKTPRHVIAAGESQSAIALTTYYDGVQPLTHAFDGFFVHSRASVALPLVAPGKYADLASSIGASTTPIFRTDVDAPVLDVQAESDVTGILNSSAAHQPDSDRFRLWEVAGTSHADVHLVSPAIAKHLDCGVPINNGPMHLVAKAALHALEQWMRTGTPPPSAPRIELTPGPKPQERRDADGIVLGGIRTPLVDVPVDVLSGVPGPNQDVLCILLGSTKPLSAERLAQLYPARAAYQQKYDADADRTIKARYVVEGDRAALLAFAQPDRIKG